MQMISSGVLTMMRGDLAEIKSQMKEDLCIVYLQAKNTKKHGMQLQESHNLGEIIWLLDVWIIFQ